MYSGVVQCGCQYIGTINSLVGLNTMQYTIVVLCHVRD